MKIYCKASLRAGGASHPSRTFGENPEVMISPSRLDDDSSNFYDISSTLLPGIYRQSLVRRPVFSLVRLLDRPWPYRVALAPVSPLAPKYAPSHARYAISCHLVYTHTPWSSSKYRNTPSTNQLHVFASQVARSVWLKKDYCLNISSFHNFEAVRSG